MIGKLILAGAACTALLAGAPGALAQGGAECQAGSAWGPTPGCDVGPAPPPEYGNNSGTPVFVPSYGSVPVVPYGPLAAAPMARLTYPDGRQYLVDQRTGQVVVANGRVGDLDGDGVRDSRDTDRDGDGVKNRRDRYPDDPRYR